MASKPLDVEGKHTLPILGIAEYESLQQFPKVPFRRASEHEDFKGVQYNSYSPISDLPESCYYMEGRRRHVCEAFTYKTDQSVKSLKGSGPLTRQSQPIPQKSATKKHSLGFITSPSSINPPLKKRSETLNEYIDSRSEVFSDTRSELKGVFRKKQCYGSSNLISPIKVMRSSQPIN